MKKLLAIILVLLMCFSFVACGGPSTDSGDSTSNNDNVEVEVPVLSVGETVKTDTWEITLTKAEFTSEIYPENPTGTYYYHDAGTKFCNLEFDITNLDTEIQSFGSAVDNMVLTCGDYVYNDHYYYYDMGGSLSVVILEGHVFGTDPLDTTHIYAEIDVPEQAASLGGTVEVTIAGTNYKINI